MIYSDKKVPYAYIHNPRTGGTALSSYFIWRGGHQLNDRVHITYTEASEIFNFDNYYTFGFVRNPFSREVSMYYLMTQATGKNMSFTDWVHAKLTNSENLQNNLIIPQIDYFCDSNRVIKANIFKYEDRKNAIAEISSILQFPYEQMANYIPTLNSPRSPEGVDYRTHYTNETIDIVSEMYKIDLETFGYTFET